MISGDMPPKLGPLSAFVQVGKIDGTDGLFDDSILLGAVACLPNSATAF